VRNNGDGTFTDVSRESGILVARESYGMTVVAADFDQDGWPDIYVACDSSPSLLFMNNHDGTFREEGVLRGVALNEDGNEQAGMGVGVGDYALDGHLDIFKTHFADDTNGLYHNDGKGNFEDVTNAARLGVETRYVCWGAGIQDLDNDGHPDIFAVAGSVYPGMEKMLRQYPDKCPRLLFRNLGNKTFEELEDAGPAIAAAHSSRGCAFGDFDNDGDQDILIVNLNEPAVVATQRYAPRKSLAESAAGRDQVEPQRNWGTGDREIWRESAGAGSAQPIELLFLQRSAIAFRSRGGVDRRFGNSLAQRTDRETQRGSHWAVSHRSGRLRHHL
jgi:hypothetical protein